MTSFPCHRSERGFVRILSTFACLLFALSPASVRADGSGFPEALPPAAPIADLTGNWSFVPFPLPSQNVTHLLVSRSGKRLLIGTSEGVASYDGVAPRAPSFPSPDAQQTIIVNAMVEASDDAIIVGTINDSLFRWKGDRIEAIYGACPRSQRGCARGEWALASSGDGVIYAVSSRFGPMTNEALAALRAAVPDRIVGVQTAAAYLGFAGNELVATSEYGAIQTIDPATGKPTRRIDLKLAPQTFVRNVSYAPDQLFIATDRNCLGVRLAKPTAPIVLAEGYCRAITSQKSGATWLSTSDLHRYDRKGWKRWSPGGGGSITANVVMEDRVSNIWIGTPRGLWRYFDISRDHRFPDKGSTVSSMVSDREGGAVVGLESGEVWRLDRSLAATRIDLPAAAEAPASPYYRGALLALDPQDRLWALNAAGLFKIEGANVERTAPYPLARATSPAAPSSLAVSKTGVACVGVVWSDKALCLSDGLWRAGAQVMSDTGGSAVAALAFDDRSAMLAVGVESIAVTAPKPSELGPFAPSPFGKKTLLGAVAMTPLVEGADAVASGGWGGTVFLKRAGSEYVDVGHGRPDVQDQPYIIRSFASHPALGLLAGTDEGLFRWEGSPATGRWRSLRTIDPRLARPTTAVVASTGRSFWTASGSDVFLIDLPASTPMTTIERSPSGDTIDVNAVTYSLAIPGLVGPPEAKTATIEYDPPIANAERNLSGSSSRLDLTNLSDLARYRLTVIATDGFLNRGSASSQFSVALPFYRNPYKLAGTILTAIGLLLLLLTRRGPTGFVLQRLGGLRWTTDAAAARFAIEVKSIGADTVRYELEAPSAPTTIRLVVDVPAAQLTSEAGRIVPYLVGLAEGRTRRRGERFETVYARAARLMGEEALPQEVRFAIAQADGGAINVDLSKSLIWLPLEIADDGGETRMMLRHAIGRTISGDVLGERKPLSTFRLTVTIFAPHSDDADRLARADGEAEAVAAAAQSWGAEVIRVASDATKQEVLAAICATHLFHYVGHAEFVEDAAEQSYLPIKGDRILASDIAVALKTTPNDLLLAFINGCGSSREATWARGAEVYGFASAFLNNASYFVGAQWPIPDEPAAAFATEFYSRLFPHAYSLWWRLIRRDTLGGAPFAEALRLARLKISGDGPSTVQTWSSYVFYGDPTRRLVLK